MGTFMWIYGIVLLVLFLVFVSYAGAFWYANWLDQNGRWRRSRIGR